MSQLVKLVDSDGSGVIDFAEFCEMLYVQPRSKTAGAALRLIRESLDHLHLEWMAMYVGERDMLAVPALDREALSQLMSCLGDTSYNEPGFVDSMFEGLINASLSKVSQGFRFRDFAHVATISKEGCEAWKPLQKQLSQLQELFLVFDDDGSGEIDSSEFEVILKRLSIKASSEQIEELISAMDYTQSGSIGFGEFVRMLAG